MQIERVIITPFDTNTYILSDSGETVIIDPGLMAEDILAKVPVDYKVKYVILTHGHFDHIMAVSKIKAKTGCAVLIHEFDAPMLESAEKSLAAKYAIPQENIAADRLLKEGDKISFGNISLTVIHTPGHTMGSVCFLKDDILFSGDTLFLNTIGIYQRENKDIMQSSLKKLLALPENITVYPGHGEKKTIGQERIYNPYAKFNWEWE